MADGAGTPPAEAEPGTSTADAGAGTLPTDAETETETSTAGAGAGTTDGTPGEPPLAWALASFHATTLVVGGVLLLQAVGALGSLLQGVRTATGLGLYAALWAITWQTNRRWLTAADLGDRRGTVVSGAKWGAVTGFGFLLVVVVTVAAALPEPVTVAILAGVGAPVSALVGAVVGATFALLDLGVLAAGRRLV